MPFQYSKVSINDFTGGITDNYINARPNQFEIGDNFLIDDNGLRLRNGYHTIYDSESLQRIMGLFQMNDDVFVIRGASLYSFNTGAFSIIQPPSLSSFFPVENDLSYPSATEWRNQLHITNKGVGLTYNRPMRVWKNDLDVFETVELGLPPLDGSLIVFNPSSGAGAFKYIYTIIYEYTYKVGDSTFKNVSAVYQEAVTTSVAIGTAGSTVNITGMPILNEARLDNNVIVKGIYRTEHIGQVSRKIADVVNANSFYLDSTPDTTTWGDGILLYTNGGLVEHFQAPKCKYMMIVNDISYYMDVVEELDSGDEIRPYRFVQGIPNAPSAIDPTYFEDLDDDIVGGSHVAGLPLMFTKSFVYRIEGRLNADGTGSIRKRVISDTIGCVSHNSIVRTGQGVFFAGLHGFYVTDGYKYKLLTMDLDDSYAKLVTTSVQGERITATYDEKNEQIIWACSESSAENDLGWVLDLATMAFTKINGIGMFFSTILYKDGVILRGDEQGFIYEHNEDDATDFRREFGVASVLWETERIPYKYKSVAIDGGDPHIRKWGHEATISIKSNIPAALRIISNNDDGERVKDMKEIRLSGSWIWRDPNFVWRDSEFTWRLAETQTKQRRFPKGHARFRRKQIQIEPSRTNLFRSDVFDEAISSYVDPSIPVNQVAHGFAVDDRIYYNGVIWLPESSLPSSQPAQIYTVTSVTDVDNFEAVGPSQFYLDITAPAVWPTNIVLDFISFEESNYVIEHQIVERVSDQRIIASGGLLNDGPGKKWVIKGFKRAQRMEIKAISITMAPLDNVGGEYKTSESGENA